ncbi:uncharacterized protein LOC142333997 [Lycorma delicatula]|uniref:uncharacterized protein LOC142333997 n=1 Tax=Lycorma delicatula TaxID=130591 RepID=UPI003F516D59
MSNENQRDFPLASNAIRNDFCVDFISGSEHLDEAIQLKTDVSNLLQCYGFPFHQWFSNNHNIATPEHNCSIPLAQEHELRTLGILWNNSTDTLSFQIVQSTDTKIYNKRIVLSITAGVFDPLGLIGPIVFCHKFFMQSL